MNNWNLILLGLLILIAVFIILLVYEKKPKPNPSPADKEIKKVIEEYRESENNLKKSLREIDNFKAPVPTDGTLRCLPTSGDNDFTEYNSAVANYKAKLKALNEWNLDDYRKTIVTPEVYDLFLNTVKQAKEWENYLSSIKTCKDLCMQGTNTMYTNSTCMCMQGYTDPKIEGGKLTCSVTSYTTKTKATIKDFDDSTTSLLDKLRTAKVQDSPGCDTWYKTHAKETDPC